MRKSLQQSDDLQLNEEEKSNANENSNSQDDDILEQIETPEPTETLKDMQLNKEFFQKNPEAKLRPGDLIVLDFGPNTKSKFIRFDKPIVLFCHYENSKCTCIVFIHSMIDNNVLD